MLTDADREALARTEYATWRAMGEGFDHSWADHLTGTVEAIVAAHVTAALNAAAEQIEAWRDMSAQYADDDRRAHEARSRALQRMNAYDRSARIVRGTPT